MKLNIQLFAEFLLEKAEGDASWKALQGKIVYTESNIDPVTNSGDLTVELWGRTWTGGSSGRYWSGVVSIDGEDVIKFSDMGKAWSSIEVGDEWVKFKSYTKRGITRDARGSKTVNISGSLTAPSVTSIGGLTSSGDLDVSLQYIPRQSVISVRSSNATGKVQPYDTLTIDISRKSTRYYEEIVFICSDGTVFDRITTSEDSITYDIPLNMLNHMLDEINYLTITAFTYTADGGLVGQTNTESKEFVIPDYAVPTVTINSVTDANTKVPSDWGVFVKGKSRPVVNASASGYYGSEVTSMELKTSEDPSSIYVVENSTATITFPVVNAAGRITVVAVDNRGKVGSASQDYAVVDYEAPKLTLYSAQKVDLDGTPNDEGRYVLFSVDGTIASCLDKNVKEVYVGFLNAGNIEWVMVEPGVDIILSDRTIDPFAKNTIYFKIKDSLGEEDVKTVVLKGIFKLLNSNKTLTALAIGKKSRAADNENLFEVSMPTEFYQDINALASVKIAKDSTGTKGVKFGDDVVLRQATSGVTVLSSQGNTMSFRPNGSTNVNGAMSLNTDGSLDISGEIRNSNLDLFNDTTGADWKEMMKNKLDYCIANIETSSNYKMSFINGGWSGNNYGFGLFSKINGIYQLVWFSNTVIRYCRKSSGTYTYYSWYESDTALRTAFPINSMYTTHFNNNPSNLGLPGTWTLIDRDYAVNGGQGALELNTTNTSSEDGWWIRDGHTINVDLRWITKVQISDSTVVIGKLKKDVLGLNNNLYMGIRAVGYTDSGNSILMVQVADDLTVSVVDIVPDDYVAAGQTCYVNLTFVIPATRMLDSACDRFHWRRSA